MKLTVTSTPFSYISGSAVSIKVVFLEWQNQIFDTHVPNFAQVSIVVQSKYGMVHTVEK